MRGVKAKVKMLETAGTMLQDFRIPGKTIWQEKQVKRIYDAANVGRQMAGLPRKDYLMLDSKGRVRRV